MAASRRKTRSLGVEEITTIMRERIAHHDLAPGEKLRESELAREFGVSRARIREVLGALEMRRLIERYPNRGAVVIRLDEHEVFEIYDVRESLESLAARLAARNAPDGAWDDLIERIGAPMDAAIRASDFETYTRLTEELVQRTVRFADNRILSDMFDIILEKITIISRRVVILPGRIEVALPLNRRLLRALKTREDEEAEHITREIISSAREHMKRFKLFLS